jgi:quinolinate synthase
VNPKRSADKKVSEDILGKINRLKKERNAIILVHNYQLPEIQDIADISGDSLELARKAAKTDADVIVFCGVTFMGETAHILSPEKIVLLPDRSAGCPLADMINADRLREMKAEHPDAIVISYVNSSAEVKAESDIICTSANAVKIVSALDPSRPIIFVPDRHLGAYVSRVTGRKLILGSGFCPTHYDITREKIAALKEKMPDAIVMSHPECRTDVLEITDYVCSTSQMFKAVEDSGVRRFIVATELGMLHPLKKRYPDREFFPPSENTVCPNMKKTNLQKVLVSLETLEYRVTLDPAVRMRALKSLERMLEYV